MNPGQNLRQEIRAAVGCYARREPSRFADTARLVEDLGIPSAKRAELVAMLEDRLGRRVPDDAVRAAHTVHDLVQVLAFCA